MENTRGRWLRNQSGGVREDTAGPDLGNLRPRLRARRAPALLERVPGEAVVGLLDLAGLALLVLRGAVSSQRAQDSNGTSERAGTAGMCLGFYPIVTSQYSSTTLYRVEAGSLSYSVTEFLK